MNKREKFLWETFYKSSAAGDNIGIRIRGNRTYYIKSFKRLWGDYAESHIKEELLNKNWSRGFVDYAKRLKDGTA